MFSSELLATLHTNEPVAESEIDDIEEAEGITNSARINVRRELLLEESLQVSDNNLGVGLWLLLMQEHMGVSGISFPWLTPTNHCHIFSEFR